MQNNRPNDLKKTAGFPTQNFNGKTTVCHYSFKPVHWNNYTVKFFSTINYCHMLSCLSDKTYRTNNLMTQKRKYAITKVNMAMRW